MDLESPPTSDDATKWKLFLPAFSYDRGGTSPETSSTDRKNLAEVGGDTAACPVPAMKLTEMTKADQSTFDAYIDKLEAEGFTYHDVGMAWGARLISPRSEEHTSELQSLMRISYAVFCLKTKNKNTTNENIQ